MKRVTLTVLALGAGSLVILMPTTAHAAPTCAGHRATIVGSSGADTLTGTAGRDIIVGLDGNDVIDGAGGNDVICGNRGADKLFGGAGDDRLRGGIDGARTRDDGTVDFFGDRLLGGPGDDVLDTGFDLRNQFRQGVNQPDVISFRSATGGVRVNRPRGIANGQGRDILVGRFPIAVELTNFDDEFTGTSGSDAVWGGAGHDLLRGGIGRDWIYGDMGFGNGGDDSVYGGAGNDHIFTDRGRDHIHSGDGDDYVIDYGQTSDTLVGGVGDDELRDRLVNLDGQQIKGGAGFDEVWISIDGNASLDLETGEAKRLSWDNIALVFGERFVLDGFGNGVWRVGGSFGNDQIDGRTSLRAIRFLGGDGNDSMLGTGGADYFDGGSGDDVWLGDSDGGLDGEAVCVRVETITEPC